MMGWIYKMNSDSAECYEIETETEQSIGDPFSLIPLEGFAGIQGLEIGGWNFTWEQVKDLEIALHSATDRWKKGEDSE